MSALRANNGMQATGIKPPAPDAERYAASNATSHRSHHYRSRGSERVRKVSWEKGR